MNKGLKEKNDLKGRSNQLPTENTKILRDFHCAGLLSIMATALEFQNAWAAAQTPSYRRGDRDSQTQGETQLVAL